MPVSGNDATTTARTANIGVFFIELRNRYISQSKLIRCILLPNRGLRQITMVISRRGFYAQRRAVVSGSFLRPEVPRPTRFASKIPDVVLDCPGT